MLSAQGSFAAAACHSLTPGCCADAEDQHRRQQGQPKHDQADHGTGTGPGSAHAAGAVVPLSAFGLQMRRLDSTLWLVVCYDNSWAGSLAETWVVESGRAALACLRWSPCRGWQHSQHPPPPPPSCRNRVLDQSLRAVWPACEPCRVPRRPATLSLSIEAQPRPGHQLCCSQSRRQSDSSSPQRHAPALSAPYEWPEASHSQFQARLHSALLQHLDSSLTLLAARQGNHWRKRGDSQAMA